MIRRPPRSTQGVSSAASDVYKRQIVRRSDVFLASIDDSIKDSINDLRILERRLRQAEKRKERSEFIFQRTVLQNCSGHDINAVSNAISSRRGRTTKPSASLRQLVAYFTSEGRFTRQSAPEDLLSILTGEAARLDKEIMDLQRMKSNKMKKIRHQRSLYKLSLIHI